MSMFHGGGWRSTPARGPEGAPRPSVLPHISPLTGYVQAFAESPSPSTRLGQLQVGRLNLAERQPGRLRELLFSTRRSLGERRAYWTIDRLGGRA
jgi:hypothetical protein